MRVLETLILVSGLCPVTLSSTVDVPARALPNAPNGYAPTTVTCPQNRPSIRSAATLSPNETSWQQLRLNSTTQAMKDFFGNVKIANFDAVNYLTNVTTEQPPNVAIAVSGGGYRAMLIGAGVVKAFDSRTPGSSGTGQLGGVVQSSTYLAGLSGGSWLVASIYANNFTTISALQDDTTNEAWQLDQSIEEGPIAMNTTTYFATIVEQVNSKYKAGFNTTVTDAWARMLSFQFINSTDGGPSYTWSSIALDSQFASGDIPMPLVVACVQGETIYSTNTTVMEFSPFEFGSWDPTVYAFAPLEYLGSSFDGGEIPYDGNCVRGFDNAGFVLGTSSSLFNELVGTALATELLNPLTSVLTSLGLSLDTTHEYVAEYINPFFNYTQNSGLYSDSPSLYLVDGGEDLEAIPFHPLIQPERKVDVIFAVDVSGDTTYGWPNGSSLIATYERSVSDTNIYNSTSFPAVPDANTFVNLGLNTRPTFFGCNRSNFSITTPLVVYLPNYPYITESNISTFDLTYNDSQRDAIILNGYNIATMANDTRESSWSTCVGCAMLSRSFDRTNTTVPAACSSCFETFCWNGTIDSTTPPPYDPTIGWMASNTTNSTGTTTSNPTTTSNSTSTQATSSAATTTATSAAIPTAMPKAVLFVLGAVLALLGFM